MIDFIAKPLGSILFGIYELLPFSSYGLAIVIFTIIVKLLLLPLTVKQVKSSSKMTELRPKMQEIQKRYKNDKEKLNQEMLKFYQENKFNPMSGCLPMFLQFPILIALITVLGKPLTYVFSMQSEAKMLINEIGLNVKDNYAELKVIGSFTKEIGEKIFSTTPQVVDKFLELKSSIVFLGLNLGAIPSYKPAILFGPDSTQYLLLLLIPILSTIATYLSSKMTMPKVSSEGAEVAMQKNMMYMMPVLSLVFAFNFPAGVGLYWLVSYVFQIVQQMFINKYMTNKKEAVLD